MRRRRAGGTATVSRFKCERCNGRLDIPDTPTDETVISCKGCGTPIGTWTEVRRTMKAEARKIA